MNKKTNWLKNHLDCGGITLDGNRDKQEYEGARRVFWCGYSWPLPHRCMFSKCPKRNDFEVKP
jgi:hypothetical protein